MPKLVEETINAPAARESLTLEYLKPYAGKVMQRPNMAEDIMLGGAAVLSGPKGWSNMHKNMEQLESDYATNEMFLKLYDGCRASPGMRIEEVDALYGKPMRVFPAKNGQTVRIYGSNQDLENIKPWLLFSCVAVIFNSAGNVTAIYSDDFFFDEWK